MNLERETVLNFLIFRTGGKTSLALLQAPQNALQKVVVGQVAVNSLKVYVDKHSEETILRFDG
jgi:hypothetical protein